MLGKRSKEFIDPVDVQQLIDIGVSLSAEKNTETLLSKILAGARQVTQAEAGTLYLMSDDE